MSRSFAYLTLLCVFTALVCGIPLEEDSSSSSTSAASSTKYLTVDDIKPCKASSANLGDCLKNTFEQLLPRYIHGDKEIGLPAIEPFMLNKTSFQYKNGAISGRITIKNTLLYGLSGNKFKTVEATVKNGKSNVHIVSTLPVVRIIGNYKGDVSINDIRIKPKGIFNITLTDVEIDQTMEGDIYEKDNHRFVRLVKYDATPKIGDFKFHATGIFPDPSLNDLIVNVTNQYWRDFYNLLLPGTRQYWGPMLLRINNEVLSIVPLDAFVSEE